MVGGGPLVVAVLLVVGALPARGVVAHPEVLAGGDCLDGGRSHTADPTGKVQRTLSLSGSKEELTALYGELRKPRLELQRAGVSILLEPHGTEVEDAFNKVGEVFNQVRGRILRSPTELER